MKNKLKIGVLLFSLLGLGMGAYESAQAESIENQVKTIVARDLQVNEAIINKETDFYNDLQANPSQVNQLITDIQNEFKVTFPPDEAQKITTINSALEALRNRGINYP